MTRRAAPAIASAEAGGEPVASLFCISAVILVDKLINHEGTVRGRGHKTPISKEEHMRRTKILAILGILFGIVSVAHAGDTLVPGQFHFTEFIVPGAATLQVNDISDLGVAVGNSDTAVGAGGVTSGFARFPNGQQTNIVNQNAYTTGFGINAEGVIVGQFYNASAGVYDGYFYYKGTFTTYGVPNLPTGSDTAITKINDIGSFCGYTQTPPSYPAIGFLNQGGKPTPFSVSDATNTYCDSINDFGIATGFYTAGGVAHGFMRDQAGNITTIDPPGSTGTYYLGINNVGWISGNFTDQNGNSHGFLGVPHRQFWDFYQIDVPGAAQTYGGGLNDFGTVAGRYINGNGTYMGYIASP
jgi:hypothetical protein